MFVYADDFLVLDQSAMMMMNDYELVIIDDTNKVHKLLVYYYD